MKLLEALKGTSLLLALGLASAASASAQLPCAFGDDGFGGPCCDQASPNLPNFPGVVEEASYACIQNCDDVTPYNMVVETGPIDFFTCDMGLIEIRVSPQTLGGPSIRGTLVAKYARTWRRLPNGEQVWRFMLNGNMEFGNAFGTPNCPVPPHPDLSHFVGSIDYTCNGSLSGASIALSLNHLPGCISHGPNSANPLPPQQAHNDVSYHLVAPNNFAWLAANDVQGDFKNDAVRTSRMGQCFPQSYDCMNEVRLEEGSIQTVYQDCLCAGGNGLWSNQEMKGYGICGTEEYFGTLDNFDPNVPTGMVSLPLGRWFGGGWLDGVQLSTYYGYLKDQNACPILQQAFQPQYVTGTSTFGYEGVIFNSGDTEKCFLDLANHQLLQFNQGCITLNPGFGAPSLSTKVWSLNPQP